MSLTDPLLIAAETNGFTPEHPGPMPWDELYLFDLHWSMGSIIIMLALMAVFFYLKKRQKIALGFLAAIPLVLLVWGVIYQLKFGFWGL
jgi:hypothetical protein